MKTDQAFTELMNQLEVLHAENMMILKALLVLHGISNEEANDYVDEWDKRFQDERKNYE